MTKTIGVLSLKGGTGKSTFSVSLAKALLAKGKKVALLDLDFTSPCTQILTGSTTEIEVSAQKGFTPAKTEDGIELFSVGLLMSEGTPMLIRGAKKREIALQLIEDIKWDSPDYLVIDFPSGIPEHTLAILRNMAPDKAIIIIQPDKLSISSAKRMFTALELTKVKVVGIIENMAAVECSKCGTQIRLFQGDGHELAKQVKTKFLGTIPFYPNLNSIIPIDEKILRKVM